MATRTCYRYGQFGHFSKDYVGKGVTQKPLVPARVYTLIPGEPEGGSEVVTGTALYLDLKLQFCLIRGTPTLSYL
jgi:hypothetical protein